MIAEPTESRGLVPFFNVFLNFLDDCVALASTMMEKIYVTKKIIRAFKSFRPQA